MTLAIASTGGLAGLGVVVAILGLQRQLVIHKSVNNSTFLLKTLWKKYQTLSLVWRTWLLFSISLGIILALWKMAVLLIVTPLFLVGLPWLLTTPPSKEIALLAALDSWIRLLVTSISTGKSIREAIFTTRTQAPKILQTDIDALCLRLHQRSSSYEALLLFSANLNSASADGVAAALAIASNRGGTGARSSLIALSAALQDRLRALREISAERSKPRTVVRQITVLTAVILSVELIFNPRFFAPYRSPLGQLAAILLTIAYLGCLFVLRHKTLPANPPSFLRRTT